MLWAQFTRSSAVEVDAVILMVGVLGVVLDSLATAVVGERSAGLDTRSTTSKSSSISKLVSTMSFSTIAPSITEFSMCRTRRRRSVALFDGDASAVVAIVRFFFS